MIERKFLPFEWKTDDAASGSFSGYGSVFDTIDSYDDTIVPGAFAQTLKNWKAKGKLPKLLLQHGGGFFGGGADDMVPIGKYDEMREDDHGLFAKGHLFQIDTDRAKAVYVAMKEGELDGLSIGFDVPSDGWTYDVKTGIRTLAKVNLWEVSIVTFPANDPARIDAVKSAGQLPTERDFEGFLRDAGFSKKQAQHIVADGFEHFLRDAGFSKDEARHISSRGYRQVRRDAMPSGEACRDLLALLNQRAAIFSGEQRS